MTLNERIVALAQAIGGDIKTLRTHQGDLSALSTAEKTNIVGAINEIKSLIGESGAKIVDGVPDSTTVWSSQKVSDLIELAKTEVKDDLVDGAGTALDTLKELADALNNNPSFATEVANQLGKRIRVDEAQVFNVAEKLQGCNNLGIGDPDHDFVTDYTTAKGV